MTTFTGKRVHILNPAPSEIDIVDIAHALANICRFGGHVPRFFSVAQHSVLVSDLLVEWGRQELALWGLLHDAAEAYLGDLIRPLKLSVLGYAELEEKMMAAISIRFSLPPGLPSEVQRADNAILATEFRDLRGYATEKASEYAGGVHPRATIGIRPYCPEVAEDVFLSRYQQLVRRVA